MILYVTVCNAFCLSKSTVSALYSVVYEKHVSNGTSCCTKVLSYRPHNHARDFSARFPEQQGTDNSMRTLQNIPALLLIASNRHETPQKAPFPPRSTDSGECPRSTDAGQCPRSTDASQVRPVLGRSPWHWTQTEACPRSGSLLARARTVRGNPGPPRSALRPGPCISAIESVISFRKGKSPPCSADKLVRSDLY